MRVLPSVSFYCEIFLLSQTIVFISNCTFPFFVQVSFLKAQWLSNSFIKIYQTNMQWYTVVHH